MVCSGAVVCSRFEVCSGALRTEFRESEFSTSDASESFTPQLVQNFE